MIMNRFLEVNKTKIIWIVFGVVQILFLVFFFNMRLEMSFSPTYYQGQLVWEINGIESNCKYEQDNICEIKVSEILKAQTLELIFQGKTWNTVDMDAPSIYIQKCGITIYSQEVSKDTIMNVKYVDIQEDGISIRGENPSISVDIYRKVLWLRIACMALLFLIIEAGAFWLVIKKSDKLIHTYKKCVENLKASKEERVWWIIPLGIIYFITSEQFIKINYETQVWYIVGSVIFFFLILRFIMSKKDIDYECAENTKDNKGRKGWYLLGVIVVCVLYAYHLTIDELHGDEAYHYLVAKGYLETGKFVQWDYVNNMPYTEYTRAWPYTLCVVIAFFIFGESLVAARAVSVVFGVLFWIILFKCLKKLMKSEKMAFVSSVIISANPVLVDIFRTIRMYAMSMPLSLLLIICVYKMLMSAEDVPSDAGALKMIYPYSIKYTLLTVAFVILNYLVMPNVLLIAGGVVLWILYKGVIQRKKQYRISVGIIIFAGILSVVLFIYKQNLPRSIQKILERVQYHVTWLKDIKVAYVWEHLKYPAGYICAVAAIIIMIIYLFKLKDGKERNFWLFLGFIELTTVPFFTLVTERGFAIRYIFYLVPISSVIVLYGIYLIFEKKGKLGKQVYTVVGVLCAVSAMLSNFGRVYLGENNYSKYSQAYEKVSRTVGTKSINLCASHYRSNYLAQYFEDVNYLEYKQTKYLEQEEDGSYVKPDIEQLIDYSKEYQTGVLTIEKSKYDYTTEPLRQIAESFMNKITGTGMDDTNVESYLYHMYHSDNTFGEQEIEKGIVYRKGIITYQFEEETSQMYIKVDTEKLPEDSVMLCINTWCGNNENMIYKSYQLVLPENEQKEAIYCVDWDMGKTEEFYIDLPAAVYTKGQQIKEIEL